jgi:DNA (cytosine-5)-methyltransferase 1
MSLTCLDLFCGCGGFSLGMQRAGFKVLAAIDFNEEAIETFKANFKKDTLALHKDLTKFCPTKLAAMLGVNSVDVIVGGPPCQGFSTVRQVDAANHGSRVRKDKRRYLYRIFLEYVAAFRPRVFVMENVLGIQSAAKGKFFTAVQSEARNLGYRIQAQVEEAWKLGVPQKRRRQLVIGVRNDIPGYFPGELAPACRSRREEAQTSSGENQSLVTSTPTVTVWDAIGDLPPLAAGAGQEECDYDLALRASHLATRTEAAKHYLESVLEISRAAKLTSHRARPHNEQDLRDFARVREGEHGGEAEARGEKMEFTYKRSCFKDRYKRQSREDFCSTIVAHLSKDGLGFIHPTQNRSLTPREAARIQSFPDWFRFPVARTHQFRIIGNAVPPLVAEAIGEELRAFLRGEQIEAGPVQWELDAVPENEDQAVAWLLPLLDMPPRPLRLLSDGEFKRAWIAIAFLYAGLHPDSTLDHGEAILRDGHKDYPTISKIEPRLLAPYYERSGWPVILAPIAREAWRRYRNKQLREDEFYCSEAQMAGMCHRSPELAESVARDRASLRRELLTKDGLSHN